MSRSYINCILRVEKCNYCLVYQILSFNYTNKQLLVLEIPYILTYNRSNTIQSVSILSILRNHGIKGISIKWKKPCEFFDIFLCWLYIFNAHGFVNCKINFLFYVDDHFFNRFWLCSFLYFYTTKICLTLFFSLYLLGFFHVTLKFEIGT